MMTQAEARNSALTFWVFFFFVLIPLLATLIVFVAFALVLVSLRMECADAGDAMQYGSRFIPWSAECISQ